MNNPKIISTIQDMLRKGEKEEEIIKTLKSLGVEEEQVKSLILISEANTFDLIVSETKKEVMDYIANKEIDIAKKVILAVNEKNSEMVKESTKTFVSELSKKQTAFEQEVLSKTELITDMAKELNQRVGQLREDLQTVEHKTENLNQGNKLSIIRKIGFAVGLILILIAVIQYVLMGYTTSLDFIMLHIFSLTAGIVLTITSLW